MTQPAARLLRLCDVCGGLDDHPRDVTNASPGVEGTVPDAAFLNALPENTPPRAVAELMDPTTLVRHIDCCASKGCQTCLRITEVTNGAHGDALTAAIESGVVNNLGSPTETTGA